MSNAEITFKERGMNSLSYTYSYYHVIFHTLHNKPSIDEMHERELYKYIWGICKNKNVFLHRIGGMPNHLHLMVNLPPSLSLADFVRELKTSTSAWLKKNHNFPNFEGWSEGYAGLSCGPGELENVVEYIKKQKEHHRRTGFAEEVRALFDKYGIKVNERFFEKDWVL